eukprot:619923-Rhodomonas_salina.1
MPTRKRCERTSWSSRPRPPQLLRRRSLPTNAATPLLPAAPRAPVRQHLPLPCSRSSLPWAMTRMRSRA